MTTSGMSETRKALYVEMNRCVQADEAWNVLYELDQARTLQFNKIFAEFEMSYTPVLDRRVLGGDWNTEFANAHQRNKYYGLLFIATGWSFTKAWFGSDYIKPCHYKAGKAALRRYKVNKIKAEAQAVLNRITTL